MKKILPPFILICIPLVIVFIFVLSPKTRDKKYEDCMEACRLNNQCLKYSEAQTIGRVVKCTEYSEPSCQNICVEKYK